MDDRRIEMDRETDGQLDIDMDEQMDGQKDEKTVQTIMFNCLSTTKRLLASFLGEGLRLYY